MAQDRSAPAFTRLRQSHAGLVISEIARLGPWLDQFDREDLEQEIWLTAWRALPRFEGRSLFATWLGGITRNVFHAWLRKQRGNQQLQLRMVELDGVEREIAGDDHVLDQPDLSEAINRLAEKEREVICLRYFDHLADREISIQLHLPLGTVKGRLRSGLSHLREELDESIPLTHPEHGGSYSHSECSQMPNSSQSPSR